MDGSKNYCQDFCDRVGSAICILKISDAAPIAIQYGKCSPFACCLKTLTHLLVIERQFTETMRSMYVLRLNVETSFRAAGYAAILLIGVLSLVPGTLRPETGAPGQFEHFVAYLGAATFLALGSDKASQRWQGLWLVPFAAALEIAQHFVPGRHSRFSDFAVSSVGAILGIIVAFGIAPILSRMLPGRPNSHVRANPPVSRNELTTWPFVPVGALSNAPLSQGRKEISVSRGLGVAAREVFVPNCKARKIGWLLAKNWYGARFWDARSAPTAVGNPQIPKRHKAHQRASMS